MAHVIYQLFSKVVKSIIVIARLYCSSLQRLEEKSSEGDQKPMHTFFKKNFHL